MTPTTSSSSSSRASFAETVVGRLIPWHRPSNVKCFLGSGLSRRHHCGFQEDKYAMHTEQTMTTTHASSKATLGSAGPRRHGGLGEEAFSMDPNLHWPTCQRASHYPGERVRTIAQPVGNRPLDPIVVVCRDFWMTGSWLR